MTAPGEEDVTALLAEAASGKTGAAERLFPLVYQELRRLAGAQMSRERRDHTLEPTALVHEAFLRLIGGAELRVTDRRHFFLIAAQAMRRILVDHARKRRAQKRGDGAPRVELADPADPKADPDGYVMALHEALDELAAVAERPARVVMLRFFGGLTIEETAALLEISHATVERDWGVAKAWLHRRVRAGDEP